MTDLFDELEDREQAQESSGGSDLFDEIESEQPNPVTPTNGGNEDEPDGGPNKLWLLVGSAVVTVLIVIMGAVLVIRSVDMPPVVARLLPFQAAESREAAPTPTAAASPTSVPPMPTAEPTREAQTYNPMLIEVVGEGQYLGDRPYLASYQVRLARGNGDAAIEVSCDNCLWREGQPPYLEVGAGEAQTFKTLVMPTDDARFRLSVNGNACLAWDLVHGASSETFEGGCVPN